MFNTGVSSPLRKEHVQGPKDLSSSTNRRSRDTNMRGFTASLMDGRKGSKIASLLSRTEATAMAAWPIAKNKVLKPRGCPPASANTERAAASSSELWGYRMLAADHSGMRKWEQEGAEEFYAENGVPSLFSVCRSFQPIRVQSINTLSINFFFPLSITFRRQNEFIL